MAGNRIYVQGSYIDVHDNEKVYLSVDKAEVKMGQEVEAAAEVPGQLKTERAEQLKDRLLNAGLLSGEWQPTGLSSTEKALVAKAVCDCLGIKEVWQVFGRLWNVKPDSMRAYFNRALEQKKSLSFQDRLRKAIG
jgi:hypothetical protein